MKKLSQFEKVGLVAAVIVICTFFYMKRVYEPREKVLKKTVTRLNKVIKEFNTLAAVPRVMSVKSQLRKHKDELKQREEELEGLTVQTGAEEEVTDLLNKIMDIIKTQDVAVNTLTPLGVKKDDFYSWNVFAVDMSGDYHRFTALLDKLAALEDPVKIDKVSINGGGRTLNITFELML